MDPNDEKDDYAGLSPEEIESLGGEDTEAGEIDELLDEEKDEQAQDEGDEGDEIDAEQGENEEPSAEEAEEAQGEAEEAAAPQSHSPPADALQSFADRERDLAQKFDNGDIEHADYMREIVQLAEDRALYRMQVQMAAEADNHAWNVANEAFFKSNPDYSAAQNPKRFEVLQAMVDAAYKDPGFAPSSYLDLLNEAKRRFDEAAGIKPAEKEKPAKPRLVSDRAGLPPTIKDAPAEAAPPSGGGEFSALDGLSGMELEAAVARMSPEQQTRWAEAG